MGKLNDTEIIIIGAYGQLGKALQQRFPGAVAVDRDQLDITDPAALAAFDWTKARIILNAAAYTNVDGAETADGRRAAWQINAAAASLLAGVAIAHRLTLVHISSEYVFDGTQSPHSETEPVTPLGVYAQSKAAGDIAISIVPQHYLLRTSWLIGDGPNFVRTMIGLAAKNSSPAVVDDQIGRLTFTPTLVDAIEHLLASQAVCGIYNVSNDGQPASWADITRTIFAELGRDDLNVTGSSTADYFKDRPEAAPRPLQSTLDLTKIKATGFQPGDWQVALAAYIKAQPKEVHS